LSPQALLLALVLLLSAWSEQFQAERQQCHAGGTLAVAFWPSQVEEQGPWQRLAHLSTSKPKPFTESSHKQPVKVQL